MKSIYLTDKLRLVTNGVFRHWCTGCQKSHDIDIFNENNYCWSWCGSIEYPTFRPSMKVSVDAAMVCHYNLVQGVMHYLGDCTHQLARQSRVLDDIPEDAY